MISKNYSDFLVDTNDLIHKINKTRQQIQIIQPIFRFFNMRTGTKKFPHTASGERERMLLNTQKSFVIL